MMLRASQSVKSLTTPALESVLCSDWPFGQPEISGNSRVIEAMCDRDGRAVTEDSAECNERLDHGPRPWNSSERPAREIIGSYARSHQAFPNGEARSK